MHPYEKLLRCYDCFREKIDFQPLIGMTLGSGLGDYADGIDIAAQTGTHVLSASAGTVLAVEDDPLMGTTVVIEHDGGYQTTYSNLAAPASVTAGETVSAGQIIGAVGDTAAAEAAQEPHLHFSVTKDGEAVDPNVFLEQ